MKTKIITVGKLKEKYWRQACAEYLKRLQPYTKVELIEVAEEKAKEPVHPSDVEIILQKEGKRILELIPDDSYCIVLAIKGKSLSSEQFAKHLEQLAISGKSKVTFIIGGSYGLSHEVNQRAELSLSFSSFTFPHQMMRVILLEQIYRAFKIQRNETYHK